MPGCGEVPTPDDAGADDEGADDAGADDEGAVLAGESAVIAAMLERGDAVLSSRSLVSRCVSGRVSRLDMRSAF
jgi:hypothetical protein